MNLQQPKYKFYATLLDAFKWYQASEKEDAEQEFLNKINRVEITDHEAIQRMGKGTALNDLLDSMVSKEIDSFDSFYIQNGFSFSGEVVEALYNTLRGSVPQTYIETDINVNGSNVLIYGYIDYINFDIVTDLKGTSSYDLGKYRNGMQRHIYPYALSKENVFHPSVFEFVVTDYTNVFRERYEVDLISSELEIVQTCAELIEFVEAKKHLITDLKIFGLETPQNHLA